MLPNTGFTIFGDVVESPAGTFSILTTNNYNNYFRQGPLDVNNNETIFEIVSFNADIASRQLIHQIYESGATSTNNVTIQIAKGSTHPSPTVRYQIDGAQMLAFTYDPAKHKWGRIRIEGTDAVFHTSTDGLTWVDEYRTPHTLGAATGLYVRWLAYDPVASTDRSVVRSINTPPTVVTEPDNAGADVTVAAGTPVTLRGTPAGRTWSQVSGSVVTIDDSGSTETDTYITFNASNSSTTESAVRVFAYGADQVTVTAEPATTATTVALNETFTGVDGAAWPATFVVQAAGGAATSGATIVGNRGRLTLPGVNTYPVLAGRADINMLDVEVEFEMGGSFDTTTGSTQEHYREVHLRMTPGGNAAGGLTSAYLVTAEPTRVAGAPWRVYLRRRVNGVSTIIGAEGSLPAPVRSMKGRMRTVGRRIQVRVWDAALAEPTAWTVDYVDNDAAAILTAGSLALVAVGGGASNAGLYVDFDNVIARAAAPPPVITATAPASVVWPDAIPLSVTGTGFTDVSWSVASAPAGSVATVANATSTSASFTPDADGYYEFAVVARTSTSSTRAVVGTLVSAQLWQYTSLTNKVPVAIQVYTDPL